jgi:glycosyltransferase involved in cell wall biosynthesis
VRSNEPLVSVMTPVYNGADFLAECIESVLCQSYQNFEYIIVNNCSTDGSLEIAQKYAAKDSRIQVHTNSKFVGVIDNHNTAFNLMSPQARYCKMVSADDYIFPDCIAKMVEFGEANASVGLIGCYQLSGDVIRWQGFRYPTTVFSGRELGRRCFLSRQVFVQGQPIFGFGTPTSLMYRADLVRESKEFYPNASPHADTSACFKYLQKCDFGFIYQVLSFERTHSATQSTRSAQMNRYASATMNDLIQYGSFYLAEDELKQLRDETLKSYHRFLAANYFLRTGNKEFWNYHEGRLKELGYPLKRFDLFNAAVSSVLYEALSPSKGLKKLWRHFVPATEEIVPPAPRRARVTSR